jgi:hypothetical protein
MIIEIVPIQQDMVGSKVAPNKADIDQFIAVAKVYVTYN